MSVAASDNMEIRIVERVPITVLFVLILGGLAQCAREPEALDVAITVRPVGHDRVGVGDVHVSLGDGHRLGHRQTDTFPTSEGGYLVHNAEERVLVNGSEFGVFVVSVSRAFLRFQNGLPVQVTVRFATCDGTELASAAVKPGGMWRGTTPRMLGDQTGPDSDE